VACAKHCKLPQTPKRHLYWLHPQPVPALDRGRRGHLDLVVFVD
jgi:hypothetical protein